MENGIIQRIRACFVGYWLRKDNTHPMDRTPGVKRLEQNMNYFTLNYKRYNNLKDKGLIP